jgi:hypothetical protein
LGSDLPVGGKSLCKSLDREDQGDHSDTDVLTT